ncbi:hypothetical protein KKF04_01380 [Patescibacteria group bacterium]|nr:hypothetical protein [Patescibacteria group bacterium]MBU1934683.1 hypothetical protein [Patescibacteria group bacterium]
MKKYIPILAVVYIFLCFLYSAWADNQNSLTANLCLQSDNLPLSSSDYEEVGGSIVIKDIMKEVAGENFNGAQNASAVLIRLSDSDFFESAGEFRSEYKNEAEFYNAMTDQFEIKNIPVSVNGYDVELGISKKEITSYLNGSYCLFTTVIGVSESGGTPHYFIYYNNIEGGSETLAYIIQSGNQVLKGNYTDDITILGTGTQVGAGLLGVDLPMDIRDLAYDLTHWEWSWQHAIDTLTDGIGLIPIIGIAKNADEVAALIKARKAEAAAEIVINIKNITPDIQKTLDRIKRGEKFPHKNDGAIFENREEFLPKKSADYYHEYVHPTTDADHAGLQRIIKGKNGELYYTPDHYETFFILGE